VLVAAFENTLTTSQKEIIGFLAGRISLLGFFVIIRTERLTLARLNCFLFSLRSDYIKGPKGNFTDLQRL
jgi:hypothetical protein